jgi:hypothetical protein
VFAGVFMALTVLLLRTLMLGRAQVASRGADQRDSP